MYFVPGELYHVYNRGNNKMPIFYCEADYMFFQEKIDTILTPYCEIICWCLMPNHFHLLIRPNELGLTNRPSFGGKPMQELAYRIGVTLSSYTQSVNKRHKRTGSLFQQKTKAKNVRAHNKSSIADLNYLDQLVRYILQNPIRAKLVEKVEDWKYSSIHTNDNV